MAGNQRDDPLAYGHFHPGNAAGEDDTYEESDRGMIGDTYRRFVGNASQGGSQQSGGLVSSIFRKIHERVQELGSEVEHRVAGSEVIHSHTHAGAQCADGSHDYTQHRYGSFAAERKGNDIKWYVDGCGYMWAVSRALEQARESIWILDCKLSHLIPVVNLLLTYFIDRVAISRAIST